MSKRQADRLNRLRQEKRGVVLLVVVSILTLFLMIGVTYVLVAGNYNSTSKYALRNKTYGDESEREMEEVMGQLLYGTPGGNGPRSVISPHSLLQDLYGNDFFFGFVQTLGNFNSGQSLVIGFNSPLTAQPIPNYFAGRVLTFTDGPAAGLSTRVMAYYPAGTNNLGTPELIVEPPESDLPIPVGPSLGCRFIINGAPFNGTGAGYSATTFNLDEVLTLDFTGTANSYGMAYLPNYTFYPTRHSFPNYSNNPPNGVLTPNPAAGALDETWDAPDYQNMFLALVPPRKMSQYDNYPLLPSFHRPDLVRFWQQILYGTLLSGVAPADQRNAFLNPFGYDGILGSGDDWANLSAPQAQELATLKRMMVLRPLRQDHPNFTGGNQNFAEDNLAGPYDVDNDGDGITDSIWIDAGLPVVTAPNGRRYKRLVAILVKDLDGRVNPSVHGNAILAIDANARTSTQVTDQLAGMNPNSPTPIYLPRGLGYGPAEVDYRHIFNNVLPYNGANDNVAVYNNFLLQRYLPNVAGQAAFPGISDGVQTNILNDDGWSRLKTIGMPSDHTNPPLSAYFTPPDVWGRAALAADYTGQPAWLLGGTGERIDDPYEVQWDQWRASMDAPYTVAELEALLRYHDLGASALPSRLMQIPGAAAYLATESRGTPGPSQVRREAFGMGTYIPAPKMIVPRELRAGLPGGAGSSSTILDLYYAAIISSRGWAQNIGSDPNNIDYANFNAQMQLMVPFEFLKGQMLNLNRELGNGIDDNGNNVIDEPAEYGAEMIATTNGLMPFDYFNDSNQPTTYDNRQMMARHLYCLAMLIRNRTQNYDANGDNMATQPETARMLAQWAINVVDFRDADSIMTRFEYDLDPFDGNGWAVDGDPNGMVPNDTQLYGGVVWGCERPELLITETVSGHDRRTEDRDDDPSMKDTMAAAMPDENFDQRLMPQGWSFIELYNPWFDRSNNLYDHKASELYTNGGVDVSRVNAAGSPVWRMIFVGSGDGISHSRTDPDAPQPEALTIGINGAPPPPSPAPSVVRSLYFADLSGMVSLPGGTSGEIYFPSSTVPRVPIAPGRYAVVGSSGTVDNGAGTYSTYIGRLQSDTGFDPSLFNLATTRRIVLNPAAQTVRVQNNRNAGDDINAADVQPVVAIPVDMVMRGGAATPQSFNITEPDNGYFVATPPPASSMWQPPGANDEGHFAAPADEPFDHLRGIADTQIAFLERNETRTNFRTVHLQRLANPMLQWNATTNPYMTVDTSSMDVMSYNGVTNAVDPQIVPGRQNFQSFQRGGRHYPTDMVEPVDGYIAPANGYFRRLWQQESPSFAPPTADSPGEMGTGPHWQTRTLYNSLGYLNKRYQPYFTAAAGNYRGAPYFQDPAGNLAEPFPWLTFNNRPFNNPSELMQVPCWHSSKLLDKYIFQDPMLPWMNMYQPPNAATGQANVPYPHLLNFFWTASAPPANDAMEMSRMFDFVETRTPYVGTEKYYNPTFFVTGNQAPAGFRPPFNYLSRFRDPGRININTIFDDNVWNAAVRGSPTMCTLNPPAEGDGGSFLARMVLSRQGWGYSSADLLTLNYDANFPSYFSHPFRTADSADMMPPNPNLGSYPAQLQPRKSAAHGGLLRHDPFKGGTMAPFNDPSVQPPQQPPQPAYPPYSGNEPLFSSESVLPYQDAARNPYFRYQPMQKVGNMFSTNSNCYAVWMTVGYFEVEANANNASAPGVIDMAHPDGLRLAQEVGVDTGEVKRHRSFFIIDRSIPVGYEPGHRHNTDKAILLKRFIE